MIILSSKMRFRLCQAFTVLALLSMTSLAHSGALTLTSQPTNTTLSAGTHYSYSLVADSDHRIYYKWYKNGVAFSSSKTLQLNSVSLNDAGTYSCRVTDKVTTIYCSEFTINVKTSGSIARVAKLSVAATPKSATVIEGSNYSFTLDAVSPYKIFYKWYKNGVAISSSNTLSLGGATAADSGTYSCRVKDGTTTIFCPEFTIKVSSVVRISTQPVSQSLMEGVSAQLKIKTTGTAPINYQWYFNGSKVKGATSNTLSIAATDLADSGKYYCIATNPVSSAKSYNAVLAITAEIQTGAVKLSWSKPTKRADGTTLRSSDIAGYELFHSASGSSNLTALASLSASDLSIVVNDLTAGTHYFSLATRDRNGLVSTQSSPVSIKLRLP